MVCFGQKVNIEARKNPNPKIHSLSCQNIEHVKQNHNRHSESTDINKPSTMILETLFLNLTPKLQANALSRYYM